MNTARKDVHNSDIPVICRACEARHKGVCGALTPEQLTKLNRFTKQHSYQSGHELLSAGMFIATPTYCAAW